MSNEDTQLQMLIAALSSMGNGVNPNLMYSAYPGKVSPAGVKSAFDPEILFSSGLVTPDVLNQLTASQLAGLQSKYSSDIQSRLPYEATDMVFAPITNKYLGDDDLSSFMRGTFNALGSGNKSLTQVLEDIQNGYITNSQGAKVDIPEVIKTNFASVQQDLTDYVKLTEGRNSALSKFQYDQQGKLDTLGPAPTAQDARSALYEQMGVPQMALLGDPNATYRFNPSDFVDKGKLGAAQQVLQQALQNQSLVRGQSASSVNAQSKAQQAYLAKGVEEQARKFSETSTAGMQTNTGWLDDVNQILAETAKGGAFGAAVLGAPTVGIGAPLGLGIGLGGGAAKGVWDWFSGNDDKPLQDAKKQAMSVAFETERKRLMSLLPASGGEADRIKYSPEYRNALAQSTRAKANVSIENAYGRIVAETIARRLAEAGKTPFQDNMNNLLGYAIRTAR